MGWDQEPGNHGGGCTIVTYHKENIINHPGPVKNAPQLTGRTHCQPYFALPTALLHLSD
jgi:hypothetical protein